MLNILLILVFIRPFISSLAFPYANLVYSVFLLFFIMLWIALKGVNLRNIQLLKFPIILLFLSLIISVGFSINRQNSLYELYNYASVIPLFFIAGSLKDADRRGLVRAILISGLVISILALYQYFFGLKNTLNFLVKNKTVDPFAVNYLQTNRVFFPFITPNILAGYLAMLVPLSFINKDRLFFIVPFSLALFVTGSIGGWLSVFWGLAIYFYLNGKMDKRRISFLCVIFVLTAIIFFLRSVTQKQHMQPMFSLAARLTYWQDTLGIILRHPLTGIGIGNFDLMDSRYAHNSYLQLCAETGILGLISFVWLIAAVIKNSLKNTNSYRNALLSAVAVFLIHNLFDFSFFLTEISLIWWAILGFLL